MGCALRENGMSELAHLLISFATFSTAWMVSLANFRNCATSVVTRNRAAFAFPSSENFFRIRRFSAVENVFKPSPATRSPIVLLSKIS